MWGPILVEARLGMILSPSFKRVKEKEGGREEAAKRKGFLYFAGGWGFLCSW